MLIEVNAVQPSKTLPAIADMPTEIVTEISPVQLAKAKLDIEVTLWGMVMEVSSVQPKKA